LKEKKVLFARDGIGQNTRGIDIQLATAETASSFHHYIPTEKPYIKCKHRYKERYRRSIQQRITKKTHSSFHHFRSSFELAHLTSAFRLFLSSLLSLSSFFYLFFYRGLGRVVAFGVVEVRLEPQSGLSKEVKDWLLVLSEEDLVGGDCWYV
jgi:hypothetical protein